MAEKISVSVQFLKILSSEEVVGWNCIKFGGFRWPKVFFFFRFFFLLLRGN